VYVNALAQKHLGWRPRHAFASVLKRLATGGERESDLARVIGA
jgi:UDP-glucose 4-epimerase